MKLLQFVEKFEKLVYTILILLLVATLIFALAELVWLLVISVTNLPVGLLENHELIAVLGVFLLVLIAVELLDTMKAYLRENVIHVEIVVLLAIIAISRKVILLDPSQTDGLELIGVGVVIVGLAAAYFLIKKAGYTFPEKSNEPEPADKPVE